MNTDHIAARYLSLFLDKEKNISLKKFAYRINVSGKKRHRVQRLLFEVISHLLTIDTAIKIAANKTSIELSAFKRYKINLLRVGTYRILFDKHEIDKVLGQLEIENSLFRTILLALDFPRGKTIIQDLALRHSFPEWMIETLLEALDADRLNLLLEGLNKRPSAWVAVNIRKSSTEDAKESLEKEGFQVEIDKDFKDALKINRFSKPINKTNAFNKGLILPVSKASIGVIKALDISAGDIILDTCSAPGIKTILMSFYLDETGKIYAVDIDVRRLKRMTKMLRHFGIRNVILIQENARKLKLPVEPNKVLIDAPCTSSGIINVSPDIKWKLKPSDIYFFADIQFDILRNIVSQLIKKGVEADIVYSTCSIFPQENEKLIEKLLTSYLHNLTIEIEDISYIGSNDYYDAYGRRFYPHLHETIGLFLTKLRTKM